jgi:hypothetical protein
MLFTLAFQRCWLLAGERAMLLKVRAMPLLS